MRSQLPLVGGKLVSVYPKPLIIPCVVGNTSSELSEIPTVSWKGRRIILGIQLFQLLRPVPYIPRDHMQHLLFSLHLPSAGQQLSMIDRVAIPFMNVLPD